jgi:NTE family protein
MQKKLALVIGSGSVKCAAALGAWKVFQRESLPLAMVVGCSGGSAYAAAIALGYDTQAVEEMTNALWTSDLMNGYMGNLKAAMAGEQEFNERSGLVDGAAVMQRFRTAFGEKQFSDTQLPLHIVATDLRLGEKVVLSTGSIADAVLASSAIPMVFPPHEIEGRLLTDGAACDPLPVDVAIKEGADAIVALGFDLPYPRRLRSFNAVQTQLNAIYINNLLRASFAFHSAVHHAEIVSLFPDFDKAIGGFDTGQFPYIIEQGAKAAEAQVEYLKRLLA